MNHTRLQLLARAGHLAFADEPDQADIGPVETPQEGGDEQGTDSGDEEPQEGDSDGRFDSARALTKIRKLNSENRSLRERAHEAEQKAVDADELTKANQSQAAEILRLRVALKHGLPEGLAARLQGSTEEELLADAEDLMALFESKKPPSQSPTPKFKRSSTPSVDESVDVNAMVEDLMRH